MITTSATLQILGKCQSVSLTIFHDSVRVCNMLYYYQDLFDKKQKNHTVFGQTPRQDVGGTPRKRIRAIECFPCNDESLSEREFNVKTQEGQ